jgi:alpha-N-arabinofuranosidase
VNGEEALAVAVQPCGLDIAASRTGTKVYLHVANLEMSRSVEAAFAVAGSVITGGRVFEIAPQDIRTAVNADQPDVFRPQEKPLAPGPVLKWRFPAASVSAVELDLA